MPDWFQQILYWDKWLFLKINQDWHFSLLDGFFSTITLLHKNKWFLFFGLPPLLGFWFWKDRRRMPRAVVALALCIAVTDNVSHRIIKPFFERPRPHHMESVDATLRLEYSPSGYSFTSNHAANNFVGASLLSAYYPTLAPVFFLYAFLVAYSRPYVGVHYPLDIFMGALLGLMIAWFMKRYIFKKTSWFDLDFGDI